MQPLGIVIRSVDGHLSPPAVLTKKCKPASLLSARGARVREGQKSPLRHPFVTYCRAQRLTRHEARSVAPKHRNPYARLAEAGDPVQTVTDPNDERGSRFQGFFRPTA